MIIHVVNRNDTVYSIADSYGVSPQRLITDNGLYGLEKLVEGQAIMILQPEKTYEVKTGDTIYSISQYNGISINEILQKNPSLAQNPTLIAGEVVTLSYRGETNIPLEVYGFMYPNIKGNVLNQSLPFLHGGAIFSYGIRRNGSLVEQYDSTLINKMLSSEVLPYMVISSIDESGSFTSGVASVIFNDKSLQDIVINNIISKMREKGYQGLDVDFEYVNPEDRDAYSDFIENTRIRLNEAGYVVNVDLAPKTSDDQRGTLYEGHDYSDIGATSNTVMVMTYEWGYTYSEPMAVAPINKVREVLEYAIQEIPRDKIYMGIPNYGYDWKLPYEKGVTRARLIGNEEAVSIASENNAVIEFDTRAQSPYFKYTSSDGSNHEVWFEDIRSIKAKYDLLNELNLRGAGYWNLMRSFNQNWAYLGYRYSLQKN